MQQPVKPIHTQPPPQDLGDAIAHCEAQLMRLKLRKRSPVIIHWLETAGYAGEWNNLDLNGFRDLYRFLKKCDP